MTTIILRRNQLPIPAQNGVGRNDCGVLIQSFASECTALQRKPATLHIGEAYVFAGQLLSQNAILL